jgi:glutathionylspermidine synthase
MLEYNADTPSTQVETGPVQAEWLKDKGFEQQNSRKSASDRIHQSNYIDRQFKTAFKRIASDCSHSVAFGFLPEDDENSAALQYLKTLYDSATSGFLAS